MHRSGRIGRVVGLMMATMTTYNRTLGKPSANCKFICERHVSDNDTVDTAGYPVGPENAAALLHELDHTFAC